MTQDKTPAPSTRGRDALEIPSRLYGRAQSVGALISAFNRVCQGHGTVLLVPGNSGSGKTSLVREIRGEVEDRNGLFLEGKFNQYHQNIPYSAIRGILNAFCRELAHDDIFSREYWSPRLRQAVRGLGALVTDLAPELEPWLGKQSPVPEINPLESRHRFAGVLRNFLAVLCRPEHPVVMFLDDMQWADAASVELITKLRIGSELRSLLVIAAYRDEEVDPSHPLVQAIEELQREAVPVEVLAVRNLTQRDVRDLLEDSLRPRAFEVDNLAAILHRHTAGNPFFTRTLLGSLHEQGLLHFDSAHGMWQWDAEQLSVDSLPDSVVKLFAEKISHLNPATAELLSLAACLGNPFDVRILAMISNDSVEECRRLLGPALADGLLVSLKAQAAPIEYRFLHDRVQQAAYDLISPAELPQLRLRVGRQLRAQLSPEQMSDRLFQVADHMNAGLALIDDAGEQVEVLRLNTQAARKARAATAYRAAMQFHRAAASFLHQPGFAEKLWAEHHETAQGFFLDRAESEFLEGDRTLAEQCVRQAVAHADSAIEKAEALNTLIVQFTLLARYPEAIAAGREALAALGILLPESDYEAARDAELASVRDGLRGRAVAELAELPVMTDPAMCTAVKLLITMGPPCYRSHQRLWSVIVPKVVNLTIRHGNLPQIGYSHTAFGGLVGWVANDYAMTKEFGMLATRLMTGTFNSPSDRSVFYLMIGSSVRHWCEPLPASSRDYQQAYEIGLASGNLQYAAYAFGHNMYCRLYQGTPLPELIQETQHSLAFSRTRVNEWAIDLLEGGLKIVQGLSGLGPGPDEDAAWEADYLRQVTAHRNIQVECIYKVNRALALLILGKCESALDWSDQAEPLIYTVGTQGLLPWAEHVFVRALILARLIPQSGPEEQKVRRAELDRLSRQLRLWVGACPENFAHKQAFVAAEIANLEGRWSDALRLFREAAALAAAGGFVHWEGLANERAAEFLETRGQGRLAQTYWQEAFMCYEQWGATAKLRAMETSFGEQIRVDLRRMPPDSGHKEAGEQGFRQKLRDEHRRQLLIKTKLVQVVRAQAEIRSQAAELAEALERLRQEVAERKRMEQSLQQANERLELAKQAAGQGIWDWNIVTGEHNWSPEIFALFGLSREAHSQSFAAWEAAVHPEDRASARTGIEISIRDHTLLDSEYRVKHPDGEVRWIRTVGQAAYDDAGHAIRMTGICMDITERHALLEKIQQWNAELERTVVKRTAELTSSQAATARAMARVAASEARFRAMFEQAPLGVALVDSLTGQICEVNPRFVEISGRTREEMATIDWMSLMHPDDLPPVLDNMTRLNAGVIPGFRINSRYLRPGGSVVWVSMTIAPVAVDTGGVLRHLCMIEDITDRKEAEDRLRGIGDNLPRGAVYQLLMPAEGPSCYTYMSAGIKDIFGISAEQVLAHPQQYWDLIVEEDRPRLETVQEKSAREMAHFSCNFRQRTVDGRVKWLHARSTPRRLGNGTILWDGVLLDVTEQKEAEDRIRSITDAAHDAIIMMDPYGAVTYWNPAAEFILGYSADEAIGANLHDLLAPERYRAAFHTAFSAFLRTGRGNLVGKRTELFARRKDGREIPLSLSLTAVSLQGNWHSVGILHDITERLAMEEEIRQWNVVLERTVAARTAELVAANAVKSEFLANMSHEIRTPMNGVIGMTGLLLDTTLTPEQRRYAETIRGSGEAMLTLINDILDLSRIEAGKLQLEMLDFDLRELLDDFAAPLTLRAREKGLGFTWEAAPEVPPRVCGDPGRLRQILNYLAGNAVKFTEEGQISVRASLFTETEAGTVIRFTVRDTGIGIPAEKQDRLFERFSQVDASASRRFGGTGLGLAIAKELAELMGGEIGMTSQPGIGSEFWFTVRLHPVHREPVNDGPAEGTHGPLSAAFPRLQQNRARILVAEDNVVNQEVALAILRKLGVRADAAADGTEAIGALKTVPYDLVLMDVQMPEMDGLEATRIIRDAQSPVLNHRIPIVAMTANAMRGDRERCLAAGMNDFVSKPVSPHALVEALNKWLSPETLPVNEPPAEGPTRYLDANDGEPAVPVFDRAGLLTRLLEDEKLAEKVIASFLESMPSQIKSVRECVEAGNLMAAQRQAHGIKGVASNVGGEQLRCAALAIEEAARVGDVAAAIAQLPELETQFERFQSAVSQFRGETHASVDRPHAVAGGGQTDREHPAGCEAITDPHVERIEGYTQEEFDSLNFGAIQLAQDGIILKYNAYEGRLSGRDPGRVIGKNFFTDVAPCTNVREFAGRFREGVASGNLCETFPFRYLFPGRYVDVEINMISSFDRQGAWIFVQERPSH